MVTAFWARLRRRGRLVAAILPAALAAVSLFPAAASAYTRGFHVYNDSGYTLVLSSIKVESGDSSDFDHPPIGSSLAPGSSGSTYHDFELDYLAFRVVEIEVTYDAYANTPPHGLSGSVSFNFYVDGGGSPSATCVPSSAVDCTPSDWTAGTDVHALNPSGTKIVDVPGLPRAQGDVLRQHCSTSGMATCRFYPSSEERIFPPKHQVGETLINVSPQVQTATVNVADTVGQTNSVGLTLSKRWRIYAALDHAIAVTHGHHWVPSHTFTQRIRVRCPARTACQVMASEPMLLDRGETRITLGGTTWRLRDLAFASPDRDRSPAYAIEQSPLARRDAGRREWGSRTVLSSTYTAPLTVQSSPIGNPSLTLLIVEPASVVPGERAAYRVTLGRAEPAGQFAYAINHVQVVSTVAGRVQRQWVAATLAPFGSRTLQLHVPVPAGARGSFCVRASASADHAQSAYAQACSPVVAQANPVP